MTFWETVERGEYIMIALAVVVILVVCIWWIRGAKLSSQKKSYIDLMQRVRDYIMEGDITGALQLCVASHTPGAIVVETGIRHLGYPMEELKSSMQTSVQIEKEGMGTGLGWLKLFAVISPLMGLTGTLIGVIDRLRDLGEQGAMVDISMLSAAIAPTIVTTVAGLVVGIISLIAFTSLSGFVDSSKTRLDEVAMELTDLLNQPV